MRAIAVSAAAAATAALSGRHIAIVAILCSAVAVLIYGAAERDWKDVEFAALYLLLEGVIAAVAGFSPRRTDSQRLMVSVAL